MEYINDINAVIIEHQDVTKSVIEDKTILESINKSVEIILDSFNHNGQLLICGNGGSAADSQHIATEFVSRFFMERRALNAEALTVNTSSLTAIANDYEYERVFARQVEAKGNRGDVLIGITTSGQSKNVINALDSAREIGMKTIAFVGSEIKNTQKHSDVVVSVPSDCTPRIQEMHILIGHIICEIVERKMFVIKEI